MSTQSHFASSEEVAGQSIRANHELILDLCQAKDALEQINNERPDVFGLMTSTGDIIKGNLSCARLLGVDEEDVTSANLKQAFSTESWAILKSALLGINPSAPETISIELPVDGQDPSTFYHWAITPYRAVSDRRGLLFSFTGQDISKVNDLERNLANIFSAIPLGVVTINSEKKIEWPYSAYTEILLGKSNLNGTSAKEGLFGKSVRFMSPSITTGMEVFLDQFGIEQEWFDLNKDHFPIEVPFGDDDDLEPRHWRRFSYNPIVRQGIVEKVLVVIEDITDRVKQRISSTNNLTPEEKLARLVFDLQKADGFILSTCISDINGYIAEISQLIDRKQSVRAICNSLHGVKGVARIANLNTFKDIVHDMEARLLSHADQGGEPSANQVKGEVSFLTAEWSEVLKYVGIFTSSKSQQSETMTTPSINSQRMRAKRAKLLDQLHELSKSMGSDYPSYLKIMANDLRSLTCIELRSIEEKLLRFHDATKTKLNKKARFSCSFSDAELDESRLSYLLEILYHLITNALDHGIEPAESRSLVGKEPEGSIIISATDDGENLVFNFSDDGAGIDVNRIRKKAMRLGNFGVVETTTEHDIMKLIFAPQFSTADVITDTSGRGIGLDSVNERVKQLGGQGITIENSEPNKGTTFKFSIKKFDA